MKKAFLFGVLLSALDRLAVGRDRASGAGGVSVDSAGHHATANDGDTVLVSPGVYYETINFSGKNITVTSTDPNDRGIVGYTIINADGDGTVVTFENGETNKAVLTGFTITGGVGTLDQGSSPTTTSSSTAPASTARQWFAHDHPLRDHEKPRTLLSDE